MSVMAKAEASKVLSVFALPKFYKELHIMHIRAQNIWIKVFVVVGLLSVLCFMPAVAQDQQSALDGKAGYNNDQLESFVMANVSIYQLQQQVMTKMSDMESDQEKQQLMQATNQQAEQILQSAGLTVDEYNTMGQTVESDVQLQEKVNSIASELLQQEEKQ